VFQTSPSGSKMHTRSITHFETNQNRRPGLSTSQSIHLRRNYSTVSIAQALVGVTCHTTILRRRSEITWRNHFTFLTWGTYSSRLMSQKPVERWNRFRPVWPVGVCTDSVLVLLLQRLNGAFFQGPLTSFVSVVSVSASVRLSGTSTCDLPDTDC
jgi:hypothetical protein